MVSQRYSMSHVCAFRVHSTERNVSHGRGPSVEFEILAVMATSLGRRPAGVGRMLLIARTLFESTAHQLLAHAHLAYEIVVLLGAPFALMLKVE